jgi:hypothetical protein
VNESNANSSSYGLIIYRDLMHQIGADIFFSAAEVRWNNISISIQSVESTEGFKKELLFAQDPLTRDSERIKIESEVK